MILVLDWAAKFTAGIVMGRSGSVQYQFDSWGKPPFDFCEEVAQIAADYDVELVIVEDVPHGISSLVQTKPVVRMQGILARELDQHGKFDEMRLLQPAVWQRSFDGVWKGGPKGARAAAELLGYTQPDLLQAHIEEIPPSGPERAKVRAQLKKAMTDYDDSFLMGRWALSIDNDTLLEKTQPFII